MPKRDYAAVHAAADRIEPRMARAVERALVKIRAGYPVGKLAAILARAAARDPGKGRRVVAAADLRAALALLPEAAVMDALMPAGTIKGDAVLRGHRIGAATVKGAR